MTTSKQNVVNNLILGLILLVFIAFSTQNTAAAIIWTDDFDDGNHDGWNIVYGAFSTDENLLRALVGQSCINHPSTVIVGTWSFDFIFSGHFSSGANIGFACEEVVLYPITGYVLKVGRSAFELVVWNESYDWIIGSYYPPYHIRGYQRIDITRDETGQFQVYINDTLQIEAIDTTISASNYFHFFSGPNEALDNISVSDSIDVTPPTNTEPEVPIFPQIPGFPVLAIILGITLALSIRILKRRS